MNNLNLFGNSGTNTNNQTTDKDTVLNDFNVILEKLAEKNTNIKSNIKTNMDQKKAFKTKLLNNLSEVNNKIKFLANGITGLNNRLTELKAQTDTNNSSIQTNTSTIDQLQKKIDDLQKEKTAAVQELNNLKETSNAEKNQLNKQIETYQSEIQQLKTENANIKKELEKASSKIEEITQTNQETITQLQNEVTQTKNEINRLNEELKNKQNVVDEHVKNLSNTQETTGNQIEQLQKQIRDLTTENADFLQRIRNANIIIQQSYQYLEELSNANEIPDEEVDNLFAQINETIEAINKILSGDSNQQNQTQPQQNSNQITIVNSVTNQPVTMSIEKVKQTLTKQLNPLSGTNSIKKTNLNVMLNNATQQNAKENLQELINRNSIKYNADSDEFVFSGSPPAISGGYQDSDDEYDDVVPNGSKRLKPVKIIPVKTSLSNYRKKDPNTISLNDFDPDSDSDDEYGGGRKRRRSRKMRRTRKLRKQKGGFTYTKKSKRTKIITKTKPTTSSRKRLSIISSRKRLTRK
jgi:chromosome segregation ATPase